MAPRSLSKLLLLFGILINLNSCEMADVDSDAQVISHQLWDEILHEHVDSLGHVDYKNISRDSLKFNEYLNLLQNNHPNTKHWSSDEQLAYWINAYNAFTVKLILDHYPVESIKKIKPGIPFINSVFDLEFIEIEGNRYSLNNIEHGIIRAKFKQPLIHFAVNCASYSCPALRNEAFTSQKLQEQLESAAWNFINDPRKNQLSADQLRLSKILQWYWIDFKGSYSSRQALINSFSTFEVALDAKIDFLDYDWSLNEQ